MTDDPKRWAEDAPNDDLAALMRGMEADLPTEAEVSSLVDAVERAVVAGGGGGGTGGAPAGGLARGALVGAGLGAAGIAGLAAWLLLAPPHEPPSAPPSTAPTAPTEAPPAPPTRAAPMEAAPMEAAPTEEGPREPADPPARAAPAPSPNERAPAQAARRARRSSPSIEEPPDELSLLSAARAALDGDPGRALSLAADHARFHPRGALTEEREVIAIDALAALGRTQAARARADAFARRWPRSAHRAHLRTLLER